MIKTNNNFKRAFTLMEIGLSLLIVSILVIVSIPIVTNQAKKTDEYSYYLAFKTVEKMGSQILAFGDPETNLTINNNDDDNNLLLKKYIANYSDKLFKFINPVAHAANEHELIQTTEVVDFTSYEFEYLKLCLEDPTMPVKTQKYGTDEYYNMDEREEVQSQSLCRNIYNDINTFVKHKFVCRNIDIDISIALDNINQYSFKDYCNYLGNSCSYYNCTNRKKKCVIEHSYDNGSVKYGECVISITDPEIDYSPTTLSYTIDTPSNYKNYCDSYGYINMIPFTDAQGNFVCVCDKGHPYVALNNKNVCCEAPLAGKQPYYVNPSTPCAYHKEGTFNEKLNKACPTNSTYNAALGKCICNDGYIANIPEEPSYCSGTDGSCPPGTHKNNDLCVSNSPVNSAKRFCDLVKYNWNVSTGDCNTFTDVNGTKYYTSLYSAITSDDTPYLSAKAKVGAFNSITPNIVFSNGLRMWILGDKSASIAGLSFNPDDYNTDINICKIKSATKENCKSDNDYYCTNDHLCFNINPGVKSPKLSDARNCCSTVSLSDKILKYAADYVRDPNTFAISGFTVFIDINGTKDNDSIGGGGTLWKDVFPFFVASNGKVYPAYPLNAAKASEGTSDSSSLYQGGNSSALSADVFYYDIVGGRRKKIVVYPSIPYARALCFSQELSAYTPYCLNLGTKFKNSKPSTPISNFIRSEENPCFKHRCFVKLKNKIKFL